MERQIGEFTYDDLLDCIAVLRNSAYGKPLAYLIALVGYYVVGRDVCEMLRYLTRRKRLDCLPAQTDVRYRIPAAQRVDRITDLKIKKSARPWSGTWHVFTYDIPTTHNAVWRRLAAQLHEMGFANMGRSSWISPYDWSDVVTTFIARNSCEGTFYCLSSASVVALGEAAVKSPANLWDLGDLPQRYRQVRDLCVGAPSGKGEDKARSRAQALLCSQRERNLAERLDPMLPSQFLPPGWPRPEALAASEKLRQTVALDVERGSRREV
ncbi:MAG: hypothetical protein ABIF82_03320 [Planctomycetota bacterium]